jgi:hypothetical protein
MKIPPKDDRLYIRIPKQKKKELLQLAKERKVSVTQIMLAALDNIPLKDYAHEKQFLPQLLELTRELHHIGNNINQATVAIHLIKNGHQLPTSELEDFNILMKRYMHSRDVLSKQLAGIFFK